MIRVNGRADGAAGRSCGRDRTREDEMASSVATARIDPVNGLGTGDGTPDRRSRLRFLVHPAMRGR